MKTLILKFKQMLFGLVLLIVFHVSAGAGIIADHTVVTEFGSIPDTIIEKIGTEYNIFYAHTSHGSQIVTGITMLYGENVLYDSPYFYEVSDDLGHNGDTSWAPLARNYLDTHTDCNMIMFSWCGGASDNTETGINIYLAKMEELEADYPSIIFIYMTGHLDGTGPAGNLYIRNNQIRDYCNSNGKILFDFADIESYDPDGVYYPDESDNCNWCTDWCSIHTCISCGGCAHSHCFNCYQKGKAWWWMMARIIGWNNDIEPVCGDANSDSQINLGDAIFIINHIFKGGPAPSTAICGDANCDEKCNLGDVIYLVNYVFKGGPGPCAECK